MNHDVKQNRRLNAEQEAAALVIQTFQRGRWTRACVVRRVAEEFNKFSKEVDGPHANLWVWPKYFSSGRPSDSAPKPSWDYLHKPIDEEAKRSAAELGECSARTHDRIIQAGVAGPAYYAHGDSAGGWSVTASGVSKPEGARIDIEAMANMSVAERALVQERLQTEILWMERAMETR
eukprot:SAG11_NODE_11240_length_774_cov_1.219259_1_plen_176_part_10